MDDTDPRGLDRDRGRVAGKAGDTPREVAWRLKTRSQARARSDAQQAASEPMSGFVRQTYALPRDEARERARQWFGRYPKAAYMTKVESWRQLEDGRIEFTMRRLPTAD
ncbi:MAG: hypothetical protein ACHQAY_19660 [Hyphomicrobiales bacterium]